MRNGKDAAEIDPLRGSNDWPMVTGEHPDLDVGRGGLDRADDTGGDLGGSGHMSSDDASTRGCLDAGSPDAAMENFTLHLDGPLRPDLSAVQVLHRHVVPGFNVRVFVAGDSASDDVAARQDGRPVNDSLDGHCTGGVHLEARVDIAVDDDIAREHDVPDGEVEVAFHVVEGEDLDAIVRKDRPPGLGGDEQFALDLRALSLVLRKRVVASSGDDDLPAGDIVAVLAFDGGRPASKRCAGFDEALDDEGPVVD